jgi:hypothetical protein
MEQCCVNCPYRANCERGELVLACPAVELNEEE